MILWGAAIWLAGLMAPEPPARPLQYAQVSVRQQIIIRVPARPGVPRAPGRPVEWKESKGPRCVATKSIAGATLLGRNSVDLIMSDNSRLRARLENSCPALDFYLGFYISPNQDGMICAGRDMIRSRVGGTCEIERFQALRAVPR